MKSISRFATLAVLTSGLALAATASEAAECKPSKWGADDEIGAANYVTPQQVLMATKLVKKGESHPLGIVVDPKMPAFPPRSTSLQIVQPGQHNGRSLVQDFGWDAVYNDDLAQLWFGTGPQIDGLGHLGEAGEYYNCNKAVDFINISGLKKLGTDKIPPMIGRGVMVDMAKHFGVTTMDAGQAISSADIKAAAKAQGVEFLSPITPCCSGDDSSSSIVAFYDPDGTVIELVEQPYVLHLLFKVITWFGKTF